MSLPTSPFESPQSTPQPTRSKAPWIILLVVGGVVLLVPCICAGILVGLAGRGVSMAMTERPQIEQVVNQYLQRMEDKDASGAYALFSPLTRRTVPQSKVEELLDGGNYQLFSDFQRASIANIQIFTSPTRTTAKVQGTIRYDGGATGTFQGVIGREGDIWMIDGINVSVPPSKLTSGKSP